ncbi:hypothetical protein [Amycolatopsis sp. lyj-346]
MTRTIGVSSVASWPAASKLWGDEAGHQLLGQVADHGARLRTLMADAEPA